MKKLSDLVYRGTVVKGYYVNREVILKRILEETRKHERRIRTSVQWPFSDGASELAFRLSNQIMLLEGTMPDDAEKILRRVLKSSGHKSQRGFFGKLFNEKYRASVLLTYIVEQFGLVLSARTAIDYEHMSYHEIVRDIIKTYQYDMVDRFKFGMLK